MVNPQDFKAKIKEIISQEYEIDFLGDDFDMTVEKISGIKAEKIYEWIRLVVTNQIAAIMRNIENQKYKGIPLNQLASFRKEIQIAGNDFRIMVIKIKNAHYIEFHMGKHQYYDRLRKQLGLTQNEY